MLEHRDSTHCITWWFEFESVERRTPVVLQPVEVVEGGDNKGDLWGHVRPVQHLLLTVIDTASRPHTRGVLYINKKSEIIYNLH